eukprot:9245712-Pyramimonas_sp.AAC.1
MVELLFDEHCAFKPVWDTLPHHLFQRGRQLIVSLLLVLVASWDFRFEKVFDDIHFSIVAMLESEHDEPDDRRKVIARRLLETPDDKFDGVPSAMFTDVPLKLKRWYFDSLRVAQDAGRCPVPLYAFLLLYRARLPYQNQSVEGHISVLQSIAKRGVRSKLPGVSDRLRNKIGDSISVKEAVELHAQVVQFMGTQEHANRWLARVAPVPREATRQLDGDYARDVDALAVRFENTLVNKVVCGSGLEFAWSWREFAVGSPVFLICWSYYSRQFVAHGVVEQTHPGQFTFKFEDSVRTEMLTEGVIAMLLARADPLGAVEMSVFRCPVAWTSMATPSLELADRKHFKVKPAPARAPRQPKPKGGPGPPEPDGPVPHDGGDHDDGDGLEQGLTELLEMGID